MGIKNLRKFLEEKAGNSINRVAISDFRYSKISVDVGFYMCKLKVAYRDRWKNGFVDMISNLRLYDIHPIFVFDGEAPVEKLEEQKKRREVRTKLETGYLELVSELEEYDKNGQIGSAIKNLCLRRRSPPLQKRLIDNPIISKTDIDIPWVRNKIEQKKWQLFNNCSEDYELTKNMFDVMGVPYITAPGEAEKMCAYLCRSGNCKACLTDDSDVIAYMSPCCLSNISFSQEEVDCIYISDVFKGLNLNEEQFVDFCILSGTDYNTNLKGIGNKTAYSMLINCNGNIDDISEKRQLDVSKLDHKRVRELLTKFDLEIESEKMINPIPWSKIPSRDSIQLFFSKHSINANVDNLMKKFKVKIIYNNI